MGYSIVKLYQNTKFYPHQNYKIDSIEDFLTKLATDYTPLVFSKCQYFKPLSLEKEIKLTCSQHDIKDFHKYNYARIEIKNDDTTTDWILYYFVMKVEWIGIGAVKLTLRMDTLNTFMDSMIFSPRTLVEREHIDRWNYSGYKVDSSHRLTILRDIPITSEGLNPQKYSNVFWNWYSTTYPIIYEFTDIDVINNTYGSASKKGMFLTDTGGMTWYRVDITVSGVLTSYWISGGANPSLAELPYLQPTGDTPHKITSITEIDISSTKIVNLIKYPYAPKKVYQNLTPYTSSNPITDCEKTEYESGKVLYGVRTQRQDDIVGLSNYSSIDRERVFNVFKHILNVINIDVSTLKTEIKDNGFFIGNDYSNESSLYSSEFLNITFSYDMFEYKIALEDIEYHSDILHYDEILTYDSNVNAYYEIKFIPSMIIDNSMTFYFVLGTHFKASHLDIKNANVMYITCNNKYPLINSEYLNYMRNGYNWDIKIRDINRQQRESDLVIGGIRGGIGALIGGAIGGIAGAGIFGSRGAFKFAQQSNDNYYANLKDDLEIEKKIAMLKGSRIGIEGTNGGISKTRLTYGFGNAQCPLVFTIDVPNKQFVKPIEDYFYYYGNKVRQYKVPTHNNRALFDYLKCEAEFINRNNVPNNECLVDIVERYKSGVTYIHKYLEQWTFDTDYKENVEVMLLSKL